MLELYLILECQSFGMELPSEKLACLIFTNATCGILGSQNFMHKVVSMVLFFESIPRLSSPNGTATQLAE